MLNSEQQSATLSGELDKARLRLFFKSFKRRIIDSIVVAGDSWAIFIYRTLIGQIALIAFATIVTLLFLLTLLFLISHSSYPNNLRFPHHLKTHFIKIIYLISRTAPLNDDRLNPCSRSNPISPYSSSNPNKSENPKSRKTSDNPKIPYNSNYNPDCPNILDNPNSPIYPNFLKNP